MTENNPIRKQYNDLAKKINLPKFDDIDKELELSDLDETNFLLRAVIRRIAEKLDFCASMLEENLQPDTSNLYAIHETRFFNEREKKAMYDLYSKLMELSRQSIEISLRNDDNDSAEFIGIFLNEWKTIREELIGFVRQMRTSWKPELDIKEDLGYLG